MHSGKYIFAHSNKSYHLGFGKSITRSNLSKANERRDPKIFEDFAYYMINIARSNNKTYRLCFFQEVS